MQLHLDFLRWKSKKKNVTGEEQLRFSRRQFLQGGAAAAFVPGFVQHLLSGRVEVRHEAGRAEFWLDGVRRWVLDAEVFAEGARLSVARTATGTITCTLDGARFAGTNIVADMQVLVERSGFGWACRIALPQHGIARSVDLLRWLGGEALAWSAPLGGELYAGAHANLRAARATRVSLDRDWKWTQSGTFRFRFKGRVTTLRNASVTVSPAAYSNEHPLAFHPSPCSHMLLVAAKHVWNASVAHLLETPVLAVDGHTPLFDRVRIDARDAVDGTARSAISFSSSAHQAFSGTLHGEMTGLDGQPTLLQLERATYTVAAEGEHHESAFFAALTSPVLAVSGNHAVHFDGQLEITHSSKNPRGPAAKLGAKDIWIRLHEHPAQALLEFKLPQGYQLPALHIADDVNFLARAWDSIVEALRSAFGKHRLQASLDQVQLRVIMPQNMLFLDFDFSGMQLSMHGGRPWLERRQLAGAAYAVAGLTAYYPPQSLQEQSFYEDNLGDDSVPPPGERLGVPVQTSLSGPSRLRFRLPATVFGKHNRLPFTLETLLRWNTYTFVPGDGKRPAAGSQIEVPYRLFLTTGTGVAFQHDIEPRIAKVPGIPLLPQPPATRAPELWATQLHAPANAVEDGYDTEPFAMTAFGAADIAQITQVQVLANNVMRAYLSQPVTVPASLPSLWYVYRGGFTPYLAPGSSQVNLVGVATDADGTMILDFTAAGVVLDATSAPVEPQFPLWVLPQGVADVTSACPAPAPATPTVPAQPNPCQAHGVPRPPMDARDRAQIVAITTGGDGHIPGTVATPLKVNRLLLSALGASFDTDSRFDDHSVKAMDEKVDLRAWRHIMVLGRDSFVQVKYAGFLFPTGHRAEYIKRTQRTFFSVTPVDAGCDKAKLFCYLRQQFFIEVRQKTRTYYGATGTQPGNPTYDFPFTSIDVDTLLTPALVDPATGKESLPSGPNWYAFVPQIHDPATKNVIDFQFDLSGDDWAKPALSSTFKTPLVFIFQSDGTSLDAAGLSAVNQLYSRCNPIDFNLQHVHFASSVAPGDTDQQVQTMTLTGNLMVPSVDPLINPHFYPAMTTAHVELPPVSALNGSPAFVDVSFEPTSYAVKGFIPASANSKENPSEVYLCIAQPATPAGALVAPSRVGLTFPGQHSGGIATPSVPLESVSRKKGAISLDFATSANPTTRDFFGKQLDFIPKLFGVISIYDLLGVSDSLSPDSLPSTLGKLVDGAAYICQQIQLLYDDYYQPVQDLVSLFNTLRGENFKQLLIKAVTTHAVSAAGGVVTGLQTQVQQQVQAAADALQQQVAAAVGPTVAQQVLTANAALQTAVNQSITSGLQALTSKITNGIAALNVGLAAFAETLDTVTGTLDSVRSSAANVVSNLRALEDALSSATKNPHLKAVQPGTDPAVAVRELTAFLEEEMTKDLGAVSDLALSLGIDATLPLAQLDASFDQVVNSQTASFLAEYDNITQSVSNQTAQMKAQLAAARAAYKDALTQTTTLVNGTIDQTQTAVATAVGDALGTAAQNIVNTVFSDGTVVQAITNAVAIVEQVNYLLGQLDTYAGQLQTALNTPVSYGLDYSMTPIPLHTSGIFIEQGTPAQPTALTLETKINASATPSTILQATPNLDYSVSAKINDFGIGLFSGEKDSFITVSFAKVEYLAHNNEHPKLTVALASLNPVKFGGALQYVQDMEDSFKSLIDGDNGPLIDLTGNGIEIGWQFGIPDILAGGFTMTGLAFSVTVNFPFDGDPMPVRFYFARPEKHFCISAGIYGGGGYLMLEGGPSLSSPGQQAQPAIDAFQMALEFGVTTGLSLGVATGQAKIMAGTYIGVVNGVCTLTGYVEATGNMEIVEIVTLALDIYVGVSYVTGGNIQGKGYVSLSISIGFFSIGVTVAMSWQWGGGGASAAARLPDKAAAHAGPPKCIAPKPGELPHALRNFSQEAWEAYADAF